MPITKVGKLSRFVLLPLISAQRRQTFFNPFSSLSFDLGRTDPTPLKSSLQLEINEFVNSINLKSKKIKPNSQAVLKARTQNDFSDVPFTSLCAARPEANICCQANDASCLSPDRSCYCDTTCMDRNDCCLDYETVCIKNKIFTPSCSQQTVFTGTVTGDPHYFSFDGRNLPYQGTCAYTITKLCDPSLEDRTENIKNFSIEARNEKRDPSDKVTWTKEVWIVFDDTKILITKDREIILTESQNSKTLTVPYTSDFYSITKAGNYFSIETKFGITLFFDGDGSARVVLGCQYAEKVCGLLGNANGDPTDDFETPDGIMLTAKDAKQLGDSWLLPSEPKTTCEASTPEPTCSETKREQAYNICKALKSRQFRPCHDVVNYDSFLKNCIYDICATGDESLACYHFQNYADECEVKSVSLRWRTQTRCPLICKEKNTVFSGCGCDNTCEVENCQRRIIGKENCQEGCFCKPGFVKRPGTDVCVSEDVCDTPESRTEVPNVLPCLKPWNGIRFTPSNWFYFL